MDLEQQNAPSLQEIEIGPLALSDTEQEVLRLYERLQDIKLEIALLKAHESYSSESTPQDIGKAQEELLAARSSYTFSKDIVDNVLIANPILKSVHHGTNASPIEKDTLPYIRRRDAASAATAKQCAELRSALDETARVQAEALRISRANAAQAAELLKLGEAAKTRKLGNVSGHEMERAMEKVNRELKESRQKWKIVKGTASAVVVGSGVEWAGDPELRDMVLDPEDDD